MRVSASHAPDALAKADPRRFRLLAALAPVLLVALGLRLAGIERLSLWVDEGFTWEVARQGPRAIVVALATYDNHPPLHYLLLWAWMHLAGSSELSLRYLSAGCGVATVALVGWLGRRLFGVAAGVVAAALLALSPFHVWYSQEARAYALLALLASAAMVAFVRALDGGRRRAWVLVAVFDALALYSHYYAAFVLAAQALVVAIRLARDVLPAGTLKASTTRSAAVCVDLNQPVGRGLVPRRSRPGGGGQAPALRAPGDRLVNAAEHGSGVDAARGFVLAAFGAALLFAPWLVAIYMQYQRAPHDYSPPIGLATVFGNLLETFAVGENPTPWGSTFTLGLAVLAALGALAALGVFSPPSSRGRGLGGWESLPILWLLAPIVLPYLLAALFRLDLRVAGRMYYIVALPAYCTLVGSGVAYVGALAARVASAISSGKAGAGARVAAVAVLALALLFGSYSATASQSATRTKEDFRGAAAYIQAHEWPGDVVVLDAEYIYRPFIYYYHGAASWHRAVVGDDATVDGALREQTAGATRAWIVLSHDSIADPKGSVRGWLHAHGVIVDQAWLNGVGVVCYSLETRPSFQPIAVGKPQAIDFGGVARLTGADVPAAVSPGTLARLTFAWQALTPGREDYHAVAVLEDSSGKVRAQADKIPVSGEYSPTVWKPGEYLVDRMLLTVPRDLPPGDYTLRLFLYAPSNGKRLSTGAGDDRPAIATVRVANYGPID